MKYFLLALYFMFLLMTPAGAAAEESAGDKKIVINIPSRSLALYAGEEKILLFPVGIGQPDHKTPVGNYTILYKEKNPVWIKPEKPEEKIDSGPDNPLGYRWMQLQDLYGIHGTNKPESIGSYVSKGCIRMKEADVELLYDLVPVGTPVEITYNRIVIEKSPGKILTYYIYPDGYNCQPLDLKLVNQALSAYGAEPFVSDESIAAKLQAADGQPTYIGKIVHLLVEGSAIEASGMVADGMIYLPAKAVAQQAGMPLNWDETSGMLVSAGGKVHGYMKKGALYFSAMDAECLFGLQRDWKNPELLNLIHPPIENKTASGRAGSARAAG